VQKFRDSSYAIMLEVEMPGTPVRTIKNDRKDDPRVARTRAWLGQRIRTLREKRGYSQQKLADGARITQKYLSEVEQGERNASVEVITMLAVALDMPVVAIWDNHEEMPKDALIEEIVRMAYLLGDKDAKIAYRMLKLFTDQ
jgi:transcriptional regulator with XRE-family HTH domain